ncbi:MAG: DUF4251 domain-containing protein [Bacteroidales bacterium]
MKRNGMTGIVMGVMVFLCVGNVYGKKDKAAELDSIFQRVKTEDVRIEIDRVISASVPNTTRFNPRGFLEIADSTAKGKLPFFGKAYSVPYGDANGVEFDGKMSRKLVEKKKKAIELRFDIQAKNENYQFFVQLFPGGNTSVRLNSNQRESISYDGDYTFFNSRGNKAD